MADANGIEPEHLEHITTFRGYSRGLKSSHNTGELILTIGVPLEERRDVYIFDEMPGIMFQIRVYRAPLPTANSNMGSVIGREGDVVAGEIEADPEFRVKASEWDEIFDRLGLDHGE